MARARFSTRPADDTAATTATAAVLEEAHDQAHTLITCSASSLVAPYALMG